MIQKIQKSLVLQLERDIGICCEHHFTGRMGMERSPQIVEIIQSTVSEQDYLLSQTYENRSGCIGSYQ